MITLGVLADTHVPDRARQLDARISVIFQQAGVDAILHAGDISSPRVLEQLARVAPVHAVRGNRDWVMLRHLPPAMQLNFPPGVKVVLTHGHGRWWNYLHDRIDFILQGYRLEHFQARLLASFPDARVIVFGHTHYPINHWVGETLVFNPGSAHFAQERYAPAGIGLLRIHEDGRVQGQVIPLP